MALVEKQSAVVDMPSNLKRSDQSPDDTSLPEKLGKSDTPEEPEEKPEKEGSLKDYFVSILQIYLCSSFLLTDHSSPSVYSNTPTAWTASYTLWLSQVPSSLVPVCH